MLAVSRVMHYFYSHHRLIVFTLCHLSRGLRSTDVQHQSASRSLTCTTHYHRSMRRFATSRSGNMAPTAHKLGGKDLPHGPMSSFVEAKVKERLQMAYEAEAEERAIPIEKVDDECRSYKLLPCEGFGVLFLLIGHGIMGPPMRLKNNSCLILACLLTCPSPNFK